MEIIGAGRRTTQWYRSYLNDRSSQVEVGAGSSEEWTSETGVIQGGALSPDNYNVMSISQPLWLRRTHEDVPTIVYADDGLAVVYGDTVEE
mgnify:FL=1